MTRVALYLRISQDNTGQHLGVDRQREDCTELAKQLDWEIAETYTDNDVSATSGKTRPAYRAMLAAIDAGEIDAIIVWHSDRLYRKVADLGDLVDVCKRNNTQIATVKMGTIDLTTPTGRLVAGLLAQVATYEGEAKSDRWRRSWQQGREAGRHFTPGTRVFGYDADGQTIEAEAAVARQMADRLLAGEGILSICRWLQTEGIRGTRGGYWTPVAVKQYLLRPRIAGWSSLDGEIVAEGDWPPLLDRETWEEVRALLTARTGPSPVRVASLTKLIECGRCGTRLITSSASKKRTYRCPNRPGMDGCGKVSGNAEPIEEIVYTYTRERLADERVRQRIAELRAEPSGTQAELANLELRVTELEKELDEPGVPVKTILRAIERTKDRQKDLLNELASRNLEPLPADPDAWPADIRRRRALVDLVVSEVRLLPATKPSRWGFDAERVVIVGR